MGESAAEYFTGKWTEYFTKIDECFWTFHIYEQREENCTLHDENGSRQSRDDHDLVGDTDWDSLNTKVTLRYFSPDNYYESYVSLTISY